MVNASRYDSWYFQVLFYEIFHVKIASKHLPEIAHSIYSRNAPDVPVRIASRIHYENPPNFSEDFLRHSPRNFNRDIFVSKEIKIFLRGYPLSKIFLRNSRTIATGSAAGISQGILHRFHQEIFHGIFMEISFSALSEIVSETPLEIRLRNS